MKTRILIFMFLFLSIVALTYFWIDELSLEATISVTDDSPRAGLDCSGLYIPEPEPGKLRWGCNVFGSDRKAMTGNKPFIWNDFLIASFAPKDPFAFDSQSLLFVIDPQSGAVLWELPLQGILGDPVAGEGYAFVVRQYYESITVHAVDLYSGHEEWQFSLGTLPLANLLVANGLLYVADRENHLFALDPQKGELIQQYFLTDDARTILYGDGFLFVITSSGDEISAGPAGVSIININSHDQQEFLALQTTFNFSDNTLVDGMLFVVDETTIVGRSVHKPQEIWRIGFGERQFLTKPVVFGDTLIIGRDGPPHGIYAYDMTTRRERWRIPLIEDTIVYLAQRDGNMYFLSGKGVLGIVNITTAEVLQGIELGNGAYTHPVIHGDLLIAINILGRLNAYALPTLED